MPFQDGHATRKAAPISHPAACHDDATASIATLHHRTGDRRCGAMESYVNGWLRELWHVSAKGHIAQLTPRPWRRSQSASDKSSASSGVNDKARAGGPLKITRPRRTETVPRGSTGLPVPSIASRVAQIDFTCSRGLEEICRIAQGAYGAQGLKALAAYRGTA